MRVAIVFIVGLLAGGSAGAATTKAEAARRKLARIAADGLPRLTREHTFQLAGQVVGEDPHRGTSPLRQTPPKWHPVRATLRLTPGAEGRAPTAHLSLSSWPATVSQDFEIEDLGRAGSTMTTAAMMFDRVAHSWTGARYFALGPAPLGNQRNSWAAITSQGIEIRRATTEHSGLYGTRENVFHAVLQPVEGSR